jgi:hypothetical protein
MTYCVTCCDALCGVVKCCAVMGTVISIDACGLCHFVPLLPPPTGHCSQDQERDRVVSACGPGDAVGEGGESIAVTGAV